jgi:uncharacterized protein
MADYANANPPYGIPGIPFCIASEHLAVTRQTCDIFDLQSRSNAVREPVGSGAMRSAIFSACLIFGAATVSSSPCGAQPLDIRSCASIPNPYERADCIRRGTNRPQDNSNSPAATRAAPSFDCRLARTSIERAICGDDELAGWDARMGQAFQQAMRTQRDPRALQENQRNWIIQRDRTCGSTPEIPFSCLLEMTKQRAAALAQLAASTPSPPPAPTPIPTPTIVPQANNGAPATPEPAARQAAPSVNVAPATSTSSDDSFTKAFLLVLFLGAVFLAIKISNSVRRKRLLIVRYGEAVASGILARQIWQGMTEEQLIESRGRPVEIGSEVMRTKTKQIWKYGQTGKNRFRERVTVENGIVSGWKN